MNLRLLFFFMISSFALILKAQEIELEFFVGGFDTPVDIANAGDERLFIVEKRGIIKVVDGSGNVIPNNFLDIDAKVSSSPNERGLLGLAFHPDYVNNGYFYVNYTNNQGNTVVSRFSVANDPNTADPNSELILMTINQHEWNHNGGDLAFGPDGYLYIGMGDGGGANDTGNYSQNPQTHLGKMLRIDVDNGNPYAIPDSNPWAFDDFALDEIWAFGLRNPWRFSFDRVTGDMWIGDVGQNRWEEIDFQPADSQGGENYGWRCYEAEQQFNTSNCDLSDEFVFPVYFYDNNSNDEGCSVTGGFVYRGSEYPSLYGKYIFTDFCSGWFWITQIDECGNFNTKFDLKGNQWQYSTFGEAHDGELFVAAMGQGAIYKITSSCVLEVDGTIQDASCSDSSDGSISINISEAQNPSIMWSTGDETEQIDGLDTGEYSVTVTDDTGCDYTQCFQVKSIEDKPSCAGFSTQQLISCPNENVIIMACDAPVGFTYAWWQDDEIIAGQNLQTLSVTESGFYQVQLIGPDCNYAPSNSVEVVFIEVADLTIEVGEGQLSTQAGFVEYQWFLDGELVSSGPSNTLSIDASGDYHVIGIDENGCQSLPSETVNVIINSLSELEDLYKLRIFPNPFDDMLIVDFEATELNMLQISISDINGRILRIMNEENVPSSEINIDTADLNSGVYFIRLEMDHQIGYKKLIKY